MKITLPHIGDQVRLIFTNDIGEVTRIIDRETVAVRIGSDIIPVFAEHIEIIAAKNKDVAPANDRNAPLKNVVKAPVPPKRLGKVEVAERLKALGLNTAPDNLPDKGLRLVMQPFYHADGVINYFLLHLINDSGKPIDFTYRLYLDTHENEVFMLKKTLSRRDVCILNSLVYDDMNENPEMQFDFEVLSLTDEDGDVVQKFERHVKPKARMLRNAPIEVGRIDGRGYVFEICPNLPHLQPIVPSTLSPLPDKDLKKVAEKLKTYDREYSIPADYRSKVEINAQLRTVDLHIEQLMKAYKHLTNTEILHIQLRHFKQQLEEAIRRHEKTMIAIHGLGKGKLKQEVCKLLLEYSEVKNFGNDYDHRFGFGATLIELGYEP